MQIFHDTVSLRSGNQALSQYLTMSFPFVPLDWAEHLLQGGVLVDGKRVSAHYWLQGGESLTVVIPNYVEEPVDNQWRLLWEGEDIVAVHKPADLPVCRTTRHVVNTLVELVKAQSPWFDAHLLHRLDHETAGIVLLGKDKNAAKRWQPQIQTLLSKKTYHAVVHGVPEWTEKTVSCYLQSHKDSAIRSQMFVSENESGQWSQTHFRVLRVCEGFSLIECELVTGRKHQIRAHLASLSHPIVGDKIYNHDGQYYLKRLESALTLEDTQILLSSHHLLMAVSATLSTEAKPDNQPICDGAYSAEWRRVCRDLGLSLPL